MHSTEIALLTEPEIPDVLDAAQIERGDGHWTRLAQAMQEMQREERAIWIARQQMAVVGMVTVRWTSDYSGFRRHPIAPEIIDLYVWQDHRKQGIATRLMDQAEQAIQARGYASAGLGVGVLATDRPAWDLYQARGYRFDMSGAWWQGKQITDTTVIQHADGPILLMMRKGLA